MIMAELEKELNEETALEAETRIENLQEFTIYPREIVDGKTVITA